jgi:TonB family protein
MNRHTAIFRRLALRLALAAGAAGFVPRMLADEPAPANAVPPKAIRQSQPEYPEEMRRSGFGGDVLVGFVINTKGEVVDPVVIRSNNPWFERAALEAILKWKFEPARINGKPVNTRAQQPLEFAVMPGIGPDSLWTVSKGRAKEWAALPPEFQWHKAPEPLSTAFPVYPPAALQAGQQGIVRAKVVIGPTGRIVVSEVSEAPSPELKHAVVAMLDVWSFTPPKKKDGTACYAGVQMKFDFQPAPFRGDVPVSSSMRRILGYEKDAPEKIVPVSQLDAAPKPLSRRPPVYPTSHLGTGRPGSARIEFFIDEKGDAQLPRIVECSEPEFGYAAAQAIATWRFEVPRRQGKPVITRVQIPMNFEPAKAGPPGQEGAGNP